MLAACGSSHFSFYLALHSVYFNAMNDCMAQEIIEDKFISRKP